MADFTAYMCSAFWVRCGWLGSFKKLQWFFFGNLFQEEKNAALSKISELENSLSESNTERLSLRNSLTEFDNKIKELEAALFNKQEQHSSDDSLKEQKLKQNSEKITALEKDLEEQTKNKAGLENELKITVSFPVFILPEYCSFLYCLTMVLDFCI